MPDTPFRTHAQSSPALGRDRFGPPPAMTSPGAAVALTLGAAGTLGTITVMVAGRSPNPTAWWGHGLATALLLLASAMALGPHRWQRRGLNVVAWTMGFSLGLALLTLLSVGLVSLIGTILLGAALLLWPHEAGAASFGWTQVWYECLGFAAFLAPVLVLIPASA